MSTSSLALRPRPCKRPRLTVGLGDRRGFLAEWITLCLAISLEVTDVQW